MQATPFAVPHGGGGGGGAQTVVQWKCPLALHVHELVQPFPSLLPQPSPWLHAAPSTAQEAGGGGGGGRVPASIVGPDGQGHSSVHTPFTTT